MKEHLDFDDLMILPEPISSINSRSECDIYYNDGLLPLFTAPMDTVVSYNNADLFINNGIIPIIPRSERKLNHTKYWVALSLDEFYTTYCDGDVTDGIYRILIDIANGHMKKLVDYIELAKKRYGNRLIIMAGNIANPQTYVNLSNAGCDYIRVGIGAGSGCLTSLNTGVGYPMATLITECFLYKNNTDNPAYIVADGGMQNYSDIIKALALGSDYVMIGGILNKSLESSGSTFKEVVNRKGEFEIGEQVDPFDDAVKMAFKGGARFYKQFRGMSTKDVQKALGRSSIRTSEGISRMRLVEYTLDGWVENFRHYLSTAMSYTNKTNLVDFIGNVDLIRVSENSHKRVVK